MLLTKMFNYNIKRTMIRKDYDDIYKDVPIVISIYH